MPHHLMFQCLTFALVAGLFGCNVHKSNSEDTLRTPKKTSACSQDSNDSVSQNNSSTAEGKNSPSDRNGGGPKWGTVVALKLASEMKTIFVGQTMETEIQPIFKDQDSKRTDGPMVLTYTISPQVGAVEVVLDRQRLKVSGKAVGKTQILVAFAQVTLAIDIEVIPQLPTQIVATSGLAYSATGLVGDCLPVSFALRGKSAQYEAFYPEDGDISFTTPASSIVFSDSACQTSISSLPLKKGQSSFGVFFKSTTTSNPTVAISTRDLKLDFMVNFVAKSPANLQVEPNKVIEAGVCQRYEIKATDEFGNAANVAYNSVSFSYAQQFSTNVELYSDSACATRISMPNPVGSITIPFVQGQSTLAIFLRSEKSLPHNVSFALLQKPPVYASVNFVPSSPVYNFTLKNALFSKYPTANDPASRVDYFQTGTCYEAIQMTVKDRYGNPTSTSGEAEISLSPGDVFSDQNCTVEVQRHVSTNGEFGKTFYLRRLESGNRVLKMGDQSLNTYFFRPPTEAQIVLSTTLPVVNENYTYKLILKDDLGQPTYSGSARNILISSLEDPGYTVRVSMSSSYPEATFRYSVSQLGSFTLIAQANGLMNTGLTVQPFPNGPVSQLSMIGPSTVTWSNGQTVCLGPYQAKLTDAFGNSISQPASQIVFLKDPYAPMYANSGCNGSAVGSLVFDPQTTSLFGLYFKKTMLPSDRGTSASYSVFENTQWNVQGRIHLQFSQ